MKLASLTWSVIMRKISICFSLLSLFFAPLAHADYAFLCGEGREGGAEKAEIALVQDPETLDMKFYLKGKALDPENFSDKSGINFRWYVTVYKGKGLNDKRFEFREKQADVQEFHTEESGAERKIGGPKKCIVQGADEDLDSIWAPRADSSGKPEKQTKKNSD